MRQPRIAALVLAAGLSSRMAPDNKLLLPLPGGSEIIVQTVDRVLASPANPVIVVTGHHADQIQAALTGRDVQFVHAFEYASGMAASLRAGVQALADDIDGVIICLGDMPLVPASVLDQIIEAFDPAASREIVIPVHADQRGNPVLWGSRFFPEFLRLRGDAGARQIFPRYEKFVAEIAVADDAVLRDFDTAAAIHALWL